MMINNNSDMDMMNSHNKVLSLSKCTAYIILVLLFPKKMTLLLDEVPDLELVEVMPQPVNDILVSLNNDFG